MKRNPVNVVGMSPDAPTVTHGNGAKEAHVPYRCDLLPPRAVLEAAAVLHTGAIRYGVDNWRGIEARSHVNHALSHVFAHLAGDTSDGHLSHAVCRLLFALELELEAKRNG